MRPGWPKVLRNRLLATPSAALAARWPSLRMLRTMRRVHGIQLAASELRAIALVLKRKAPCRLLVFGLGNDSGWWLRLNAGGTTAFLEDNAAWIRDAAKRHPGATIHLVSYGTRRSEWRTLLDGPREALDLAVPQSVAAAQWDVILVDAPAGWSDDTPGRMKSIHLASRIVAVDGDVFVHDCDREVERAFCDRLLVPRNLVGEIGRLRHYRPSNRATPPTGTAP